MSPRITRSSARQAASQEAQPSGASAPAASVAAASAIKSTASALASQPDLKRKADSSNGQNTPHNSHVPHTVVSSRQSKRRKTTGAQSKAKPSTEPAVSSFQKPRRKAEAAVNMGGTEYVAATKPSSHPYDLRLLTCNCVTLNLVAIFPLQKTTNFHCTPPRRAESRASAKSRVVTRAPLPDDRDIMGS